MSSNYTTSEDGSRTWVKTVKGLPVGTYEPLTSRSWMFIGFDWSAECEEVFLGDDLAEGIAELLRLAGTHRPPVGPV